MKSIKDVYIVGFIVLIGISIMNGQAKATLETEYQQDLAKIKAKRESLSLKLDKESFQNDPDGYMKQLTALRAKNDLDIYKGFADGILDKWITRNPQYYALLTRELCADLRESTFDDGRSYDLRRQYALSALQKSDEISNVTELDLIGYVTTFIIGPDAEKGEVLAQRRKKDVEVRLHAWRRLHDGIDPTWNPNDLPQLNVVPPKETGLPAGVSPQEIEDTVLRAEYEAAIEANKQKSEKYNEQYELHKWLKRYPKRAEEYIVRAYSVTPYNNEELVQYLNDYKIDEETKNRIIDTVTKNIEKQKKVQK